MAQVQAVKEYLSRNVEVPAEYCDFREQYIYE